MMKNNNHHYRIYIDGLEFGEWLNRAVESIGTTNKDLEIRTGLANGAVHGYILGKNIPKTGAFINMMKAMGVKSINLDRLSVVIDERVTGEEYD